MHSRAANNPSFCMSVTRLDRRLTLMGVDLVDTDAN